ncbi:NAC domain-containing protein 90 [Linum grandiflorum]
MALTPPGFRFYPTEEELISFYLHHKLESRGQHRSAEIALRMDRVIPLLDIYLHDPWDLPRTASFSLLICQIEEQWFFFRRMQEREGRGGRPKRVAGCGYWKATGSLGYVYSSGRSCIGEKRTMVFYNGKAPNGRKTIGRFTSTRPSSISNHFHPISRVWQLRHEYSLIRLYKKSKCLRSFDRRPIGIFQLEPIRPAAIITTTSTTTSTAQSHANNQLLLLNNITNTPPDQQHHPSTTTSTPDDQLADHDDADAMMPADDQDRLRRRKPSGLWGYIQELDMHFNGDDHILDLEPRS